MKYLLDRISKSVKHLHCLDNTFLEFHDEYGRIEEILTSEEFDPIYKKISLELYAGGKQTRGNSKMARQMILGDVIQYIFTGRAYYYASNSRESFSNFIKLLMYSVNKLLILDTITVDPDMRKKVLEALENEFEDEILYEREGDQEVAENLKESDVVIWTDEWTKRIDHFIDSLLPKTLGNPKELIVYAELLRLNKGYIIPLLLTQRVFKGSTSLAPPDFLLLKTNKEIYGIEVGYEKEGQSREFSIHTSIPTFAVDLKNNMHNRCPKCGENILYCDPVIEAYSSGRLNEELDENGRFSCNDCPHFNDGDCKFSNYYGKVEGIGFNGKDLEGKKYRHYHANCVKDDTYQYYGNPRSIFENHSTEFFAQIPEIDGIENVED